MRDFPGQFDDDWARRAERRARRAHRLRPWIAGTLWVGGVLGLLFGGGYLLSRFDTSADGSGGNVSPTVNQIAHVDPKHPFDNTPSATWQEGAAGIQPPAATPVGCFSADTVAATMDRAKQLIVAARLDPHVLETYDAEPVLQLLAQGQVSELRNKTLTPGNEAHNWWLSSKLAHGYPLLPVSPRVDGSMTAAQNDKGELAIHTDYLIAYAFAAPPGRNYTALDIVAVVREQVEYDWVQDSSYDDASQGMWFGEIKGFAYSVNCQIYDQGYLAPDYSNPTLAATGPDPHRPEYYFDPTVPIPQSNNC
ncbi:hypothetical protein [Nocardia heshunensis]